MSFDPELFQKNVRHLLLKGGVSNFCTATGISEIEFEKNIDSPEPSLKFVLALSDYLKISVDRLLRKDLSFPRTDIKLLVLDVDGVLTEGGMYYTQSGDEFKRFHTRDGMAIKRLTASGFQVAFLSSGINDKLVNNRAALLGVQLAYTGLLPKMEILTKWKDDLKLEWNQIGFVGDDVNDLAVISKCGFTACPADATEKVKSAVDVILETNGGHGCIREFIEKYLLEI